MGVHAVAAAPSRFTIGAVLGDALRLYRREWRSLIPSALVLSLSASIFALVLDIVLGGAAGALGAAFVVVFALFFLPLWLQALDLHQRVVAAHEERGFLAAVEGVRPRLPAVTGAILLIAFLETLGFLFLIIPGFVLATRWSLVMPAIVVEGLGVRAGMRRSRELVRGHGWRVFGTIIVNALIAAVPVIALTLGLAAFLTEDYAEFFRTITVESLIAPFTALLLTSLYDALATGDLPVPGRARTATSFAREAKAPAIAGRALGAVGAVLTLIGLFYAFSEGNSASGFESLQTADLLATEIAVTCIALIAISFFSRTRMPLLAVSLFGFFNLGQTLPDKPFLEHLALGGYLSLGGALVLCCGAILALLAPPARRPSQA